jgi:hypothetical protein
MKKVICFACAWMIAGMLTADIQAGTISAGIQTFYASWDSGMGKMTASAVEAQLTKEMEQGVSSIAGFTGYSNLEVGDPESSGFVYGPILGYRTEDKKWDFTLALMWFGTYTTSVDASVSATGTGSFPFVVSTTVTLPFSTEFIIEHRDIDFQAGYMLTELFRIFAGYKYQSYETTLGADYNFNYFGQQLYASHNFTTSATMHMPYVGGGIVYAINNWATMRANLGFGFIVAGSMEQDNEISGNIAGTPINTEYNFSGAKVEMAYCLMGNIILGITLANRVNIEVGYQYQRFTFKVKDADLDADGQADDSGSETDYFYGFTMSAVYLFTI